MRRARSGRLITYNDQHPAETCVNAIAEALKQFLDGHEFGVRDANVDLVTRDFSAREMTRLLAHVLDEAAK